MRLSAPLFLAAASLLASSALANEPARAEESFIPNFSVGGASYSQSGRADLKDGSGSLQRSEAEASGNLPIFFGENFRLMGGLEYRWTQFDFESAFLSPSLDLYSIQLPFNLWADISDRWKLWVRLQPGLQSDLEDISEDDFILMSLALASYQWNDWLTVAFGGFYSRDLGEERLLPAFGLILRSNPHWSLALTFPRLEFAYAPNADWLLTASTILSGGGWNITDPTGGPDINLYYQAVRAGFGNRTPRHRPALALRQRRHRIRPRARGERRRLRCHQRT
jgi:hypothetical protein